MTTTIQWTDETWNPTRGCSRVSPGCQNCYAEDQARRFAGAGGAYEGLVHPSGAWNGKIRLVEEALAIPLRWRRPRRVFVDSMSDLFHEAVPFSFVDRVFAVMAADLGHTFQILTKRPERMLEYMTEHNGGIAHLVAAKQLDVWPADVKIQIEWPLPNVWLGVSVEDQPRAQERLPLLLKTPAAIRFLSCEPLLEDLDLSPWLLGPDQPCAQCPKDVDCECSWKSRKSLGLPSIDWIIAGGESGRGARPLDVEWLRQIVSICELAEAACFIKQLGAQPGFRLEDEERRGNFMPSFHHYDEPSRLYIKRLDDSKGGSMNEWPEDLRIRQFPQPRSTLHGS